MAILIGSPASSAGKTTITLALLAALKRRGLRIQSFKVGPDYIDPMFHTAVTGQPCRNLDPFLTSEAYVQQCFSQYSQGSEGIVIEGVMGLFDGKVNHTTPDYASSAHVARLLSIPVVLVIDAAKVGFSVAAIVHGFKTYDSTLQVAGVIFNRVSTARHGEILKTAMQSIGVSVLGLVYSTAAIMLPSRHLGLVPVKEVANFKALVEDLVTLAESALNWDELLPLIQTPPPVPTPPPLWADLEPVTPIKIGVAWDAAFNFYYADNLDLLQQLGAELIYYSPLEYGLNPPTPVTGLYLGGGFPEIYAEHLSPILQTSESVNPFLPIYAECGGLMVLGRSLTTFQGEPWPMAGIFPFNTQMGQALVLGYREATVLYSTVSVVQNYHIRGHEFHHSKLDQISPRPIYTWASRTSEGWSTPTIHASYLHVHWGSQPVLAYRWLQSCLQYKTQRLGSL